MRRKAMGDQTSLIINKQPANIYFAKVQNIFFSLFMDLNSAKSFLTKELLSLIRTKTL